MKKIIYAIIISLFISCQTNEIVFSDTKSENILVILDSLEKYDDYILGDFNGEFLVSTNAFYKSVGTVTSMPIDSNLIDYHIGYKLLNKGLYKNVGLTFLSVEPKDIFNENYRFSYFDDFIGLFDREEFIYYQKDSSYPNTPFMVINYSDLYETDSTINYSSFNYDKVFTSNNFSFTIESVKIINKAKKGVQVNYSFSCIGYGNSGEIDEIKIMNGKGRSTFEYNP